MEGESRRWTAGVSVSVSFTLRIIGPPMEELNPYRRGRVLKIASFEGSGYLGYTNSHICSRYGIFIHTVPTTNPKNRWYTVYGIRVTGEMNQPFY